MSAAAGYRALSRMCPTCGAESGRPCRIGYGSKVHAARFLPEHLRQPMTPAGGVPRVRSAGRVLAHSPQRGTHAGPGQPPLAAAAAGSGAQDGPGGALGTGAAARLLDESRSWQKLKAGWPELADAIRSWIELGPRCMGGSR